ncbi:Branchpoint-bridging protein-like protein [Hapsidospora chrysogenum ATCC 11550]|uniref:Branchpoint-bridging protein n=1 Tax=Hapsidospora chrysogenum (strain ATCC 11550 / CBS 779.69 / DSM 880 / IAM 14645 / JCM 23072 / IMI 49137) TaxID=857340 RepID=A0A086TF14_HAPC1|nr:Branchpoint-bridging protein-like protein [Hapsidospora chrysogenum ATCC 11550]
MEKQTGATIAIRGKGSVKEGRAGTLARYGAADDGNQPLHVRITSESQRKVDEGKRLIQQIIDNAVSVPDYQNEHKLKQLRNVAMANGTFRDDEGQRAQHQIAYYMNPARGCASDEKSTIVTTSRGPSDAHMDEEYKRFMGDIAMENGEGKITDGQPDYAIKLPPWRMRH